MGYFSNGEEGISFQNHFCDRCALRDAPDDGGCRVWLAHVLYNSLAAKDGMVQLHGPMKDGDREIPACDVHGPTLRILLDTLIVRTPQHGNRCMLFVPKGGPKEGVAPFTWCPGCGAVPVATAHVNEGGRCRDCEADIVVSLASRAA